MCYIYTNNSLKSILKTKKYLHAFISANDKENARKARDTANNLRSEFETLRVSSCSRHSPQTFTQNKKHPGASKLALGTLLFCFIRFSLLAQLLDNGSYTARTYGSTTLTVLRIVNRHENCCFYVFYVAYIAHVAQKINGSEIF